MKEKLFLLLALLNYPGGLFCLTHLFLELKLVNGAEVADLLSYYKFAFSSKKLVLWMMRWPVQPFLRHAGEYATSNYKPGTPTTLTLFFKKNFYNLLTKTPFKRIGAPILAAYEYIFPEDEFLAKQVAYRIKVNKILAGKITADQDFKTPVLRAMLRKWPKIRAKTVWRFLARRVAMNIIILRFALRKRTFHRRKNAVFRFIKNDLGNFFKMIDPAPIATRRTLKAIVLQFIVLPVPLFMTYLPALIAKFKRWFFVIKVSLQMYWAKVLRALENKPQD